jgi:hypothetical protein
MAKEQHVRDAIETFVARLRRDLDAHLRSLSTDLVRLTRETHESGRAETLGRLLGSFRLIDESSTLSGILEALSKGAAELASRVAILVVEGEMLRVWGHFGFAATVAPVDEPIGHHGLLAAAVVRRQTLFVPSALDDQPAKLPSFMRAPAGHAGLVMPIVVARDVVAVLYANGEDPRSPQEKTPVWTEELELLVRHAAARLESVTSERTVEVLTRPV